MRLNIRLADIPAFLFFLLISFSVQAQVTPPDTVRRKTELPTGPTPVPTQQQRQQPRDQEQQRPAVQRGPAQQQAQVTQQRPSLLDKLYTGGGFGLQFGNFTNVSISPILGYMATEKFWFGGGLIYQYQSVRYIDRSTGQTSRVSRQNYGTKIFAQQEFLNLEQTFLNGRLLAHAEYELLNMQFETINSAGQIQKFRRVEGTPLLGLGYRQAIGARATADLYFLYNLSNSMYTPYSNPVIRFSFNIPFRK